MNSAECYSGNSHTCENNVINQKLVLFSRDKRSFRYTLFLRINTVQWALPSGYFWEYSYDDLTTYGEMTWKRPFLNVVFYIWAICTCIQQCTTIYTGSAIIMVHSAVYYDIYRVRHNYGAFSSVLRYIQGPTQLWCIQQCTTIYTGSDIIMVHSAVYYDVYRVRHNYGTFSSVLRYMQGPP